MKFPEQFRATNPKLGDFMSKPGEPFGVFIIPGRSACGRILQVIACDGAETGWDHVSITIPGSDKCPSWPEMSAVKDLFWDKEECVVQFHPPESEYVNHHPDCLHLWKCTNKEFPTPPPVLVGPTKEK